MELSEIDYDIIEDILDKFDFYRVMTAMRSLNWLVPDDDCEMREPEISYLRKTARDMLRTAAKNAKVGSEFVTVYSGGFFVKAIYDSDKLYAQILFSIEKSDNYEL